MLNVVCPLCEQGIRVSKPKQGRFTPTCSNCSGRFQLLIKQLPDKSYLCKASPLDPPKKVSQSTASKELGSPKSPSRPASSAWATSSPTPTDPLDATRDIDHDSATQPEQPPGRNTSRVRLDADATLAQGATQPEGTANTHFVVNSSAPVGKPQSTNSSPLPRTRLGPYRLIKLLGEGGMGAVYLANQTTLDRHVALKVVRSHLTNRPGMIARFTREAYAAAQLIHPNVIQIYDMGDDNGDCYFSMELVNGISLGELIQRQKKLDPEQAARYILQAARGLQCAHNAGMVHRDIKPANLMVNQDGVVKVADLGLVKVPDDDEIEEETDQAGALSASTDLTMIGSTVGTPYYMAPEQAKSSINVDHRADIYSLGCTFYVLLTGKRPYEGNSIQEVASKHNEAPLIVPSKIVERVPKSLSDVVAKMMAKHPDDRYQNAGELISVLENFLGVSSATAFTPREADADTIETANKEFNKPALLKLRTLFPLAILSGSLLVACLMMFVNWRWATGFLLLPITALGTYFLVGGISERTVLFDKARELVFRSGFLSWLNWFVAIALWVFASFLMGALAQWIVIGLLGSAIGASCYYLIDYPSNQSRKAPLAKAESLIRSMRLKGLDESTIRLFVAKYCGNHWEEFFETLFGYKTMRSMRAEITQSELGKRRPKFRAWRDDIADRLDQKLAALTSEEERKHLQKIEQAGLQAQGISAVKAKEQAAQMAEALVDHGDSIRMSAMQKRLLELDPQKQRMQQRQKVKTMLADARSGKYKKEKTLLQTLAPKLNLILGTYTRFLVGCCLIVGCLMWARQNGLGEQLTETAIAASQTTGDSEATAAATLQKLKDSINVETTPLGLPIIGDIFYNFNSLVAGLILLASTIIFGWRMAIFAFPAAAITLWGESWHLPEMIVVAKHLHVTSALIGIGIFVLGVLFGRSD
ncbi:MAG: bifunctional serine/threonine protein kinase/MFS transporter [Mariniblastus sp.]|nr:bifunctional serine/threonine protein kinase/MFS transporter [Mariniblastus sp.]